MPKYGTVFQVLLQLVVAYHRTELGLKKSQGAIPLQKNPVYIISLVQCWIKKDRDQSESINIINCCQKDNFKDRSNIPLANTVLHQVYY